MSSEGNHGPSSLLPDQWGFNLICRPPSPPRRGPGGGSGPRNVRRALTLTLSLRERGLERNSQAQAKSVMVTKPVVWNVVIDSTTSGTSSIEIVSLTIVSGCSFPDATMFSIDG